MNYDKRIQNSRQQKYTYLQQLVVHTHYFFLPVNKVELLLHEPDVCLDLLKDVLRLAVLRLRLLHFRHNLPETEDNALNQCCGSGSAIRLNLALLDPNAGHQHGVRKRKKNIVWFFQSYDALADRLEAYSEFFSLVNCNV